MLGFSTATMNAYQNGSPSALDGEAEQTRDVPRRMGRVQSGFTFCDMRQSTLADGAEGTVKPMGAGGLNRQVARMLKEAGLRYNPDATTDQSAQGGHVYGGHAGGEGGAAGREQRLRAEALTLEHLLLHIPKNPYCPWTLADQPLRPFWDQRESNHSAASKQLPIPCRKR